MNRSAKQYLIILLIVVFSVGILYWLKPVTPIVPHGIVLPAEHTLPPTQPEQVSLLGSLSPNMRVLGQISIRERQANKNEQQLPMAMVKMAQNLAASVGANGLVLSYGLSGSGETGVVWVVRAVAVNV